MFTSCTEPENNTETSRPESFIFPHTEYEKVVAYHFEDLNGGHIIDKNGQLNQTVKKEKTLNETEISSFFLQAYMTQVEIMTNYIVLYRN